MQYARVGQKDPPARAFEVLTQDQTKGATPNLTARVRDPA